MCRAVRLFLDIIRQRVDHRPRADRHSDSCVRNFLEALAGIPFALGQRADCLRLTSVQMTPAGLQSRTSVRHQARSRGKLLRATEETAF